MSRHKTVIGRGAFGKPVPEDQHAVEVLRRILSKGLPPPEDAIFLCMLNILRQNGSLILQKVRARRAFNVYRYFQFSTDIDLLEVRQDETVGGYELKGHRGTPKTSSPHHIMQASTKLLLIWLIPFSHHSPNPFLEASLTMFMSYTPRGQGLRSWLTCCCVLLPWGSLWLTDKAPRS